MRLLLLQISDIHVKTPTDWILSRAGRVADAVRDLDHQVGMCVVALTGDVAYSGTAQQYASAERWVIELVGSLRRALGDGVPVHVVAIPGNHDCDLSQPSVARTTLIDAMQRDPRVAADPSSTTACMLPQQEFFAFRDRVAGEGMVVGGQLYYEYEFVLPLGDELSETGESASVDGRRVRIRCLNSAWVSQNPEIPAKLVYPESSIRPCESGDGERTAAVVVSMLHHPYNWLEPMNARAVRRVLQSVSDVILTGHEHATGVRQQQDEAGGNALYIEGLALQQPGTTPPASEFHAVLVDTERHERRVVSFSWHGSRYDEDRGPASAWAPFSANPLRAGHLFPVSERMRALLADPGITLTHPTRGALSLDQIFVYPDLSEVQYEPGNRQQRVLRGEDVLARGLKAGRLLITGTDEAGKTALAKRLFLDALDAGLVPVLLDGTSIRLKGDQRDRRELAGAFEDQYDAKGDAFLDTPREKRVVLLDDYAEMRAGDRPQVEVLEYLTHFAGLVIVFANSVAQQVLEISGLTPLAKGRVPFAHYRLLPVSHIRREEMIERYVSLAGDGHPEKDEQLRADMRRILSVALGKYYAPPVPVSVISILQARAFNDQLNLTQSTYGYYYELLITRALLSNTSPQELDVRKGYLTALAYAVYRAGGRAWNEGWMMTFHQEFIRESRLDIRYGDAVSTLLDAGILEQTQHGFTFRYKYYYYYFVSRALAARLTSDEGREDIRELTNHLDEQDPANILLFLTHHSKDAAIIDPMLQRAEMLFQDVDRADLTQGSLPIQDLDLALREVVYEEAPVSQSRRRYLERRDVIEQEDGSNTKDDDADGFRVEAKSAQTASPTAPLARSERDVERDAAVGEALLLVSRIYVSFRTMQILGQLLKNFPGTLSGDQKERITRAVYGVALRTLGAVQQLFRESPDEQAQFLVEALRQEHPDLSTKQLVETARATFHWQLYQTAFGVTQRTAADVGSPLLDPVFSDIEVSDPIPAIKLISAAIRLDRAGGFPEKQVRELAEAFDGNPMALRVLRGLVVTHFHMFEVDRTVKQRVCALLKIEFRPQLPVSRRRLIARETS